MAVPPIWRETMSVDWFRNTAWSDDIARAFEEKLRRARNKPQYLRVQASTLASTHPDIALKLLDRYFECHEDFEHAQAYVDRATALLVLGRIGDAIAAYEAALARESVFPNLRTQAYIELPFLVAARGIQAHYRRAKELLNLHESRLMFPVEFFRWNAAQALIATAAGESDIANCHAKRALVAAGREHSGFRFHPAVGLVTEQYDEMEKRLANLCAP